MPLPSTNINSITDSMDMCLSRLKEIVDNRGVCCAVTHGITKSQTQLSNRTTIKWCPSTQGAHLLMVPIFNKVFKKKKPLCLEIKWSDFAQSYSGILGRYIKYKNMLKHLGGQDSIHEEMEKLWQRD